MTDDDAVLGEQALIRLTGYRQPAKQLEELLRQGFTRARLNAAGRVVLEGPHYRAVCEGKEEPVRRPVLLPA